MTSSSPLADASAWLLQQAAELIALRDSAAVVVRAQDVLLRLCGAELAYFFEVDSGKTIGIPKSGRDALGQDVKDCDTRTQAYVSQAVAQRRTFLLTDASGSIAASTVGLGNAQGPLRVRLLVVLPLICGGALKGALYAQGKADVGKPVDAAVLDQFAALVAAALHNAHLFERATNDLLTGLPNNTSFVFHLEGALQEPMPGRVGGILLLDLDDFARVNRAANAEAGDQAMVNVAGSLRELLRSDGLVCRLGSDKFAVLLPHDDAHPVALRLRDVAERARAAIGTKQFAGVRLSASIGAIGFATQSGHSARDLLARANAALATARMRGAGQVEIAPTLT